MCAQIWHKIQLFILKLYISPKYIDIIYINSICNNKYYKIISQQPVNAPISIVLLGYSMNIGIKISLALWFGLNCVLSNLYVEVLTLVL